MLFPSSSFKLPAFNTKGEDAGLSAGREGGVLVSVSGNSDFSELRIFVVQFSCPDVPKI